MVFSAPLACGCSDEEELHNVKDEDKDGLVLFTFVGSFVIVVALVRLKQSSLCWRPVVPTKQVLLPCWKAAVVVVRMRSESQYLNTDEASPTTITSRSTRRREESMLDRARFFMMNDKKVYTS